MRPDVSRPPVIVRNGASQSITIAGIVTSTVSKVTLPGCDWLGPVGMSGES